VIVAPGWTLMHFTALPMASTAAFSRPTSAASLALADGITIASVFSDSNMLTSAVIV
jgi:hypothetical protein